MRELVTDRLTLRALGQSDLARISSLAGDFRVARMLSDMPYPATIGAMQDWLAPRGGEVRYAIVLGKEVIGSAGYFHTHRGRAELGYWLGSAYWGRGYALEATASVVREGRDRDDIGEFTASYFIDNPGSGRILQRLGFQTVGRTRIYSPARGAAVEAVLCSLAFDRVTPDRPAESWLRSFSRLARAMFGSRA